MTPDPVEVSPRVLQALSKPLIHHYYKGFIDFYAQTTDNVKKIFQTENDLLILQGEAALGLEAAVLNTVNPDDKVLVLNSGPFDTSFGNYVQNARGKTLDLSCPTDDAIEPGKLEEVLDVEKDIKVMTVVHCETPTGILNPIEELCPITKKHGILTIVDVAASLGGVDIKPDSWGIDLCVGSSQKAVSAHPGSTMVSVSRDGWEAIEHKTDPIKHSYISLIDYRDAWIKERRFPYTPIVTQMYGLAEAASELLKEGLENSFRRHKMVADACRREAEKLGLRLWAKRRSCLQHSYGTDDSFLHF
jgi:aspartate aminotransferase-like enzyme